MHPQVYETWFSHLQIPRYLIACVMIQDTRPRARFTGPKLRRWCSVAPCSASLSGGKVWDIPYAGRNHTEGK